MSQRRFVLLLVVVFATKLVVLLQLRNHPLTQPSAGLDTTVYTTLAQQVLRGDYALGPGLYFVSPLYIYFLAAVLALMHSFTAVRLVQITLGTAAVACIFICAREWFGSRAAWMAAGLAGLTGLFTFHEVLLLQAALDPFLTGAALAALSLALGRQRRERGLFVAGVLFGIQTLNRPNVLIAAAVIVVLLAAARRWRWSVVMSVGLATALIPVTVRNANVAGDWSPVSSHGGLNFFIGNNPEADGTYHDVAGITPNIAGQQEDARRVAEHAVGRALDDGQVSAYFYDLGWRWIRKQPQQALALFARKLAYVFNAAYIPLNYSFPFYAYDARTLLAALPVGPWLLIPLGLAGLVIAASRERRLEYWVWASFVPAYAISVAVFFVSERYRLPLLVPLCIGAGAMLDWIWVRSARRRSRRNKVGRPEAAALATVCALALFANWPLHLDDGRAEERTRMAEALIAEGRYDEGEEWTRKAEQHNAQPGVLHFRVARQLIAQHRPEAALPHLQRALEFDPDQPEVDYAFGEALLDMGRAADAVPHLRKAVSAGVRLDVASVDLVRALGTSGDRAGALQVLQTVRPANARDADSWDALGQLAMQLDAPALATTFFREAIAAAPRASTARQDLGLALARLGQYQEAVASFEEAVQLDPSNPTAHLNLAVAYAQTGRTGAARTHAQDALRLKPDYTRAREFLSALK